MQEIEGLVEDLLEAHPLLMTRQLADWAWTLSSLSLVCRLTVSWTLNRSAASG